jgi:hypothetical protein
MLRRSQPGRLSLLCMLVGAVAGLVACDLKNVETSSCRPTTLRADAATDLSQMTAQLVDADGVGVAGRLIRLAAVYDESRGGGHGIGVGGETDVTGSVTVDLQAGMEESSVLKTEVSRASRLIWYYENPDKLNADAPSNYCSSEAEVELSTPVSAP